jgi:uncharacterized protein with NRDE domain
MCLLLIALQSHPDYPLILAANRDEFYDRPTAAADFWSAAPEVLGGRDLKAGGTWLGITRRGRVAAVTNYREGPREPEAPRSRGSLVSDFLIEGFSPEEYLQRVHRDADRYRGFNLLVGDPSALWYYSNREGQARSLQPGAYGLSNHLLDTPWPKVAALKGGFTPLLGSPEAELTHRLFQLLSDRRQARDSDLPVTGVSPDWERVLSSAFIVSSNYGTRSSTVILFRQDRNIIFIERSFGPGGTAAGEARYQLGLRG